MKCFAVTVFFLLSLSAPAQAQEESANRAAQLIEAAALSSFLDQMEELCEITDEFVFAQSVLLLGEHHNWEIWSSDFAGSGPAFYLFNVLEESELPVVRLTQAVRRNAAISEEDLARAEGLFDDHAAMREVAQRVYDLVSNSNLDAAAELYLERTIPLRRSMRYDCYTVFDGPRRRIADLGLAARIGR